MLSRRSLPFILAGLLALSLSLVQAEPTLQEQYLDIYVKMHDAENLEKDGHYAEALKGFQEVYAKLIAIRQSDPEWEPALVVHRAADCQVTIDRLQREAAMVAKLTTTTSSPIAKTANPPTPPLAVGSPVTRTPPLNFKTDFPEPVKNTYPWKTGIKTGMFYIGEKSAGASAWDSSWAAHNQGHDDPFDRNGFASSGHASTVNPFYFALPFNDLVYPDKAKKYLPMGWQRDPVNGNPVSACKDRWIEIKAEDGSGRICYAQWEDVGPNRADHAEYVFGPEHPDAGKAGLDVSPAVADYLGIGKDPKPSTMRWRFVDAQDIPPGQWLKLDEQAILYTAMHQSKEIASATPSKPRPDKSPSPATPLAPDSTKP